MLLKSNGQIFGVGERFSQYKSILQRGRNTTGDVRFSWLGYLLLSFLCNSYLERKTLKFCKYTVVSSTHHWTSLEQSLPGTLTVTLSSPNPSVLINWNSPMKFSPTSVVQLSISFRLLEIIYLFAYFMCKVFGKFPLKPTS